MGRITLMDLFAPIRTVRGYTSAMKRAIVIVLDGCGAGSAPDAAEFNDFEGPSTLRHTWDAAKGFTAPFLLGSGYLKGATIPGEPGLSGCQISYGRLKPMSKGGKDSVTGHWEMMGIVMPEPFPPTRMGFRTTSSRCSRGDRSRGYRESRG